MSFTEYASRPPEPVQSLDNILFLERLDTFMQKSLSDIRAFAERESRSYEETRHFVTEWHAKALFTSEKGDALTPEDKATRVRKILIETSKVLESLSNVTGVQSFLLAVDPQDPRDAGFLGGSLLGREYYRGLRGGGTTGAASFKIFVQKRLPSQEETETQEPSVPASPAPPTVRSAKQAKVTLYESIRSQLRKVSGIRKAEMKWTNPERLSLYGVRMIGWPPDIPAANPSSLKANQNQRLLELVEQGELRFEKTMMTGLETPALPDTSQHTPDVATTAEVFSWAYDADGGGDGSVGGTVGPTALAKSIPRDTPPISLDAVHDPMLSSSTSDLPDVETNLESTYPWKGDDDDLLAAENNESAGFDEYEFHVEPWNDTVEFEGSEGDSPIERRARKRARSSESEDR